MKPGAAAKLRVVFNKSPRDVMSKLIEMIDVLPNGNWHRAARQLEHENRPFCDIEIHETDLDDGFHHVELHIVVSVMGSNFSEVFKIPNGFDRYC